MLQFISSSSLLVFGDAARDHPTEEELALALLSLCAPPRIGGVSLDSPGCDNRAIEMNSFRCLFFPLSRFVMDGRSTSSVSSIEGCISVVVFFFPRLLPSSSAFCSQRFGDFSLVALEDFFFPPFFLLLHSLMLLADSDAINYSNFSSPSIKPFCLRGEFGRSDHGPLLTTLIDKLTDWQIE